jgi:hypothetical protein
VHVELATVDGSGTPLRRCLLSGPLHGNVIAAEAMWSMATGGSSDGDSSSSSSSSTDRSGPVDHHLDVATKPASELVLHLPKRPGSKELWATLLNREHLARALGQEAKQQ